MTILCTSFLPEGYAASAGGDGAALVTPASVRASHATDAGRGPLRYAGMEVAIADIGCFLPICGRRSARSCGSCLRPWRGRERCW